MSTIKVNGQPFDKPIYIIGNGVIAKALAVALSIEGKKVTILRGSVDEEFVYQEHIEIEFDDENLSANVTISSLNHYQELDGIVLLTNKSFGNKALAGRLKSIIKRSPIVFLQNGLHIEESFIDQGFNELYRCVLLATSQSVAENKVRFKLVAPSPVGVIKGSENMLLSIVSNINTNIFSFRTETDIQTVIWKKVISNCVFNSICPLLETDNGVFHRNDSALRIAGTVISECLAVAVVMVVLGGGTIWKRSMRSFAPFQSRPRSAEAAAEWPHHGKTGLPNVISGSQPEAKVQGRKFGLSWRG